MNNDIFLDEMRNNYESLKYFTLKDNKLVLTYNNLNDTFYSCEFIFT